MIKMNLLRTARLAVIYLELINESVTVRES